MYAASLIFLAAAAVTLALGIRREGLELLFVSIACSGVAAVAILTTLGRRLRASRSGTDDPELGSATDDQR